MASHVLRRNYTWVRHSTHTTKHDQKDMLKQCSFMNKGGHIKKWECDTKPKQQLKDVENMELS